MISHVSKHSEKTTRAGSIARENAGLACEFIFIIIISSSSSSSSSVVVVVVVVVQQLFLSVYLNHSALLVIA